MAPVCMADRLRPRLRLGVVLFVILSLVLCSLGDCTLITYDRDTLLNLRFSCPQRLDSYGTMGGATPLPPVSSTKTTYLPFPFLRRKRFRKRGRRSGAHVRVKAYIRAMAMDYPSTSRELSRFIFYSRSRFAAKLLSHRWICPVGPQTYPTCPVAYHSARSWITPPGRGVQHSNLNTLRRATANDLASRTRMALFNVRSLSNKAFLLNDFFLTTGLDVLFLTETWTSPGEFIPFSELLPPDCAFFSSPRLTGRGGGLASVFKNKHEARLLPSPTYSSFEAQLLELTGPRTTLCVVVYRLPKYHKMFISEFADFLGSILFKYGSVIISGDFNIHVCCMDDQLANDFLALTASFNLTQWVNEPTHVKGHTLDLVFSYDVDICIKEIRNTGLSDHSPVIFDLDLGNTGSRFEAPLCPTRTVNADTLLKFSNSFVNFSFTTSDCLTPHTLENFANTLLTTCSSILDIVAPIKMKRPRTYSQCWLNDSVRALRRMCRRDERRWRKDNLQSSYDILCISRSKFQSAARTAKAAFLSKIITTNGNNPRILFKIFNSVVNPCPSMPLPCSPGLCQKFSSYFLDKVASLKSTLPLVTDHMPTPDCSTIFCQFEPVSLSTLKHLIEKLNNTNLVHDVLPSRIVKDCFNAIGPCLLSILNSSLLSGYVPSALKHAIIQPVLKKSNLDQNDYANYRPISKLPFVAKILEKVVLLQLQTYLDENNINDKYQSAFKQHHSTESALLRVFNDLLLMADNGRPSVLVLLDLSSAFDMVDHNILLARLEHTSELHSQFYTVLQSK
ncbi:uncharacterized protein LOC120728698 [Simochromis diagramma]|uniref:uncharacterized protein LOC120728698 n=1 Tax=Simochromis diagramma TaxID=43689 RepID=UPI001A7E2D10|nr:uncharacterized protein LOC120728698 [Simochromis diagramma]